MTRKSDGVPVGAVAGFCNMLWRLLKEADHTAAGVKPTHLAVVFDHSAVTFRNAIYDLYKAQRPEPPADLRPQFGLIREAVRAFNVACVEQQGFEADDLIATYTTIARKAGADVTIVSSDKDLMQLVDDKVVLLDTMKDKRLGIPEVAEKFGVPPDKVVDVQSLAGDSVDNVPGVPGIGVKTAAQLILEYGDLESLLARAGEIKQPKRRESLIQFAEQARISRRLVQLDCAVRWTSRSTPWPCGPTDGERLIAFCKGMEFSTLTRRVAEATGVDTGKVQASVVPVKFWPPEGDGTQAADGGGSVPLSPTLPLQGGGSSDGGSPATGPEGSQSGSAGFPPPSRGRDRERGNDGSAAATISPQGDVLSTPFARAAAAADAIRAVPLDHAAYETVTTVERLQAWVSEIATLGLVSFDTETNSLDSMQADLVGVSLATAPGKACYIPLAHVSGDGDLLGGGRPRADPDGTALAHLKPSSSIPRS